MNIQMKREHYFNSHPHKEDDYCRTGGYSSLEYFNSHPHKEDD